MADGPNVAENSQIWVPGTGQDPARLLLAPKFWTHKRPKLMAGANKIFTWPIGIEGFRRTGSAQLGIHHYIGDNNVDVEVVHLDEARIEMNGVFPGVTAVDNMVALIDVLMWPTPEQGKMLELPGVFPNLQLVVAENYEFDHTPEDQTHSISYSVTFIRTGRGRRIIPEFTGQVPPQQPGGKGSPRGGSAKTFTTRNGAQTLKAISKIVYKRSDLWRRLVDKNRNLVKGIPIYQLPDHRFPIGKKVNY